MKRIATFAVVAVLALGAVAGPADAKKKPKKPNPPTISAKEYARLAPGITYAQAVAIIGGPGEEISRVDIAGTTTIMYMWEGKGLGNANAMFQNDALITKAQFGL